MAIFPKCPRHPEREEVTSPSWCCSDRIHFGVGQTWSSLSPASAGRPPPSLPSEKHPPPLIAIETEWGPPLVARHLCPALRRGRAAMSRPVGTTSSWNRSGSSCSRLGNFRRCGVAEGRTSVSPGKFPKVSPSPVYDWASLDTQLNDTLAVEHQGRCMNLAFV